MNTPTLKKICQKIETSEKVHDFKSKRHVSKCPTNPEKRIIIIRFLMLFLITLPFPMAPLGVLLLWILIDPIIFFFLFCFSFYYSFDLIIFGWSLLSKSKVRT